MTEHMEMAEVTLRCEECVSNMTIDREVCVRRTEMETEQERNKTKVLAASDFQKRLSYYDCTSHYNTVLQ